MTLTALFRDFLIIHKAKRKFERYFLIGHPEFRKEGGAMDWDHDHYESHIRRSGEKFSVRRPSVMMGYIIDDAVFMWSETEEGKNYWLNLARKFDEYYTKHKHMIQDKYGIVKNYQ